MQLEDVPCPLCAANDRRPWGRENGFDAVKCNECGLVYVSPRPTPEEIDAGTRIGSHRTEAGELKVSYKPNFGNLGQYRRDIPAAFAAEIAAGRPIAWLDVGAGYGEFVKTLGELLPAGSSVRGIELMEPKVAYAQAHGLPVASVPLDQIEERFDVVSIMNVLSHIPDFRGFLAQLKGLLKEGGTIFLRTGNGGDMPRRADYPDKLDLPDHLLFAGRAHVERFLTEAGFTVRWSAADRLDGFKWFAKSIVKRLIGRSTPIVLPYSSRFRDMRYRADLPAA